MTIPTLITNYEKKKTVSQLIKATSTINNAFNLSIAYNGEMSQWNYSEGTGASTLKFLEKYLFPYLKTAKVCQPENNKDCFAENTFKLDNSTWDTIDDSWATFVLADGSAVAMMHELYKDANTDEIYREQITFRFDTNGKNPPNRTGRDVFCYDMTVWENNLVHMNNKRVEPCFAGYIGNRDDFTKTNGFCASDKTSHGLGCGALIQLDGWKISDDYPW